MSPPLSPATQLVLLLLFLLAPAAILISGELESDRAALLAFRASVTGRISGWNSSTTPCSWRGVTCRAGRVAFLRLPGRALSGAIPSSTLSNLTALRTLSLRLNSLSGPLPPDLSNLIELRNLYLHGNRFSSLGETVSFPPKLIRLDLANNAFSGKIPPGIGNLSRLSLLYLENNNFSGEIPRAIGDLPNLRQFNVSYNDLNGSIPAGKLREMPASSYMGIKNLCGGPLGPCPGEAPSPVISPSASPPNTGVPIPVGPRHVPSTGNKSKLSGGAIAGIAVGGAVLVLMLLALLICLCRRRSNGGSGGESKLGASAAVPSGSAAASSIPATPAAAAATAVASKSEPRRLVFVGGKQGAFDLDDLLRASAEVLGKGTFGTAYKAVLEMGTALAVKRLRDVTVSEKEFRDRVEEVGEMEHPNLVKLRAYYYSKDEKLLVYDYMPMGSLSAVLHGNKGSGRTLLDWDTRSHVALAVARGIAYIHSSSYDSTHGNIKSSNVLLDKLNQACVSDYGLVHLVKPSSNPARAAGYRAPEVTDSRKISQKADVYSYGVLLLELLTGKAPVQTALNEEGVDLPRWVKSVVREEWSSEVFDSELLSFQSSEEEMVQMLQLAVDCTDQYPDKRPSMVEVVTRMEEICRSRPPIHQL